jgi:hypothetical protein
VSLIAAPPAIVTCSMVGLVPLICSPVARWALDDFGTGYSTITNLVKVPLDIMKVDQSFIAPLETGGRSAALVRDLLQIAASMGVEAIAEGIEVSAQRDALVGLGCRLGQVPPGLPGRSVDGDRSVLCAGDESQSETPCRTNDRAVETGHGVPVISTKPASSLLTDRATALGQQRPGGRRQPGLTRGSGTRGTGCSRSAP